ncbi:putative oligopeptidase B transcription factor WD40-like family [Helianthus annuus]|nr:putative oligopeptidase B transcription factor WD40-like family [Helianthus annuus]
MVICNFFASEVDFDSLESKLYYQCIPEKKEYPMLCRKSAVENTNWVQSMINYAKRRFSNEEILLDWNEIAQEHGYVHVGTCRISPDHRFLAYTIDTTGEEQFLLQVKDLQTGTVIPTFRVEGVVSVAWAQDSCTLFYTLCDQSQRPYRQASYTQLY